MNAAKISRVVIPAVVLLVLTAQLFLLSHTFIWSFFSAISLTFIFHPNIRIAPKLLMGSILAVVFLPTLAIFHGGKFAGRLMFAQTETVAHLVSLSGLFASLAVVLGYFFATKVKVFPQTQTFVLNKASTSIAVTIAFGFLLLHSAEMGASIFAKPWHKSTGIEIGINTLLQASAFCLMLWGYNTIHLKADRAPKPIYVACFFYISFGIILTLFKGARLDFLQIAFSSLILIESVKDRALTKPLFLATMLGFGYLLLYVVGLWRFLGTYDISKLSTIQNPVATFFGASEYLYYIGTFGDLSADVFGIHYLFEHGKLQFGYGEFLANYASRTLPSAISGNQSPIYDYYLAGFFGEGSVGGGFHPLAQGFLAGGFIGVFFLYFLLSLLVSRKINIKNGLSFLDFLQLAAFASFLRGSLYGLFGLYKGIITAALIAIFLVLMSKVYYGAHHLRDPRIQS